MLHVRKFIIKQSGFEYQLFYFDLENGVVGNLCATLIITKHLCECVICKA
jgi:hypothetical protein